MGWPGWSSPRLSFGTWTFLEEELNDHPVSTDSLVVLAAGGHQGSYVWKIFCRTHPDTSDHVQEATASSDPGCRDQASTSSCRLFVMTNLPWVRWEVTFQVLEPFMYLFIKCAISYHGENFLIQGGVAIPSR